jgi:hypothetical protein
LATMSRTGSRGKRFMRGRLGMMLRIGLGGEGNLLGYSQKGQLITDLFKVSWSHYIILMKKIRGQFANK